jgi:hypothetical protein
LDQLNHLSNEKSYDKIRSPACSRCCHRRVVTKIKHDSDNWLMPVAYHGFMTKKNRSPPLSQIPKFLRVGGIDFKLSFISYSQDIPGHANLKHEVSIHLIRGQFYLYNGLSPLFSKWVDPTYEVGDAGLFMIVYLRQTRLQGE